MAPPPPPLSRARSSSASSVHRRDVACGGRGFDELNGFRDHMGESPRKVRSANIGGRLSRRADLVAGVAVHGPDELLNSDHSCSSKAEKYSSPLVADSTLSAAV